MPTGQSTHERVHQQHDHDDDRQQRGCSRCTVTSRWPSGLQWSTRRC